MQHSTLAMRIIRVLTSAPPPDGLAQVVEIGLQLWMIVWVNDVLPSLVRQVYIVAKTVTLCP